MDDPKVCEEVRRLHKDKEFLRRVGEGRKVEKREMTEEEKVRLGRGKPERSAE